MQYIVDNAYPPIVPVIKRLIFVDSRMLKYCISQSVSIIIHPIKQNITDGTYIRNNEYAITLPINTPVHLAQTGN